MICILKNNLTNGGLNCMQIKDIFKGLFIPRRT